MESNCASRDEAVKKFGKDITLTCNNCSYLKNDNGIIHCSLIDGNNENTNEGEFFNENY